MNNDSDVALDSRSVNSDDEHDGDLELMVSISSYILLCLLYSSSYFELFSRPSARFASLICVFQESDFMNVDLTSSDYYNNPHDLTKKRIAEEQKRVSYIFTPSSLQL